MPTEPMAVIWDVDGTLVDTAEMHFAAWARLAGEMGRPFSREDFTATFGRRNPEIIRFLFREDFSDADVARIGETKETYYRSAAERGTDLLPGVANSSMGSGLLAFVRLWDPARRGNLDLLLRITETQQYFDAIVGMEDTQRGKPDPQVFLVAAEKLHISPSRCVVLEDAIAGVEAAKAGGMKCVGVTFVGHHPAEKLKAAGADRVVKCFTEITAEDVLALLK